MNFFVVRTMIWVFSTYEKFPVYAHLGNLVFSYYFYQLTVFEEPLLMIGACPSQKTSFVLGSVNSSSR